MIRRLALFAMLAWAGLAQETATERYERLYPRVRDDSAVPQANEQAAYAWGVSYFMLADVRMFQATGDPVHAGRALAKMANILERRDDRRGVLDYRGVSMAAWRNVHYQLPAGRAYRRDDPENDRYAYCYAVHSGMIVYPMAVLAELIRARGTEGAFAGRTYQEWAGELIERVRETVAAHDEDWADHGDGEGYYRFPDFPPHFAPYANRNRDVPFNQSHTLGATMCVLYRVTGESAYAEKAWRLAQRFKRSLAVNAEGAYTWMYWQRPGVYAVTGAGEDISHAALNVTFAREAYDTGLVFDDEDMRRFARTLAATVLRPSARSLADGCGAEWEIADVSDTVGAPSKLNTYWNQVGRWLEVTPYEPPVFTPAFRIVDYAGRTALCANAGVNQTLLLGQALGVLYEPVAAQ